MAERCVGQLVRTHKESKLRRSGCPNPPELEVFKQLIKHMRNLVTDVEAKCRLGVNMTLLFRERRPSDGVALSTMGESSYIAVEDGSSCDVYDAR